MSYKDLNKQRVYQRDYVRKRREEYFHDKCCVKCGSKEELEIDHIDPKTKVSHRIWSWSDARRASELQKCQILCRDCHDIKSVADGKPLATHGTLTRYEKGCHCEACRAANAARMRRKRQRARANRV